MNLNWIMNVDFNSLRKQACKAYDALCDKLNEQIIQGEVTAMTPDCIQQEMDDLRTTIASIAMCFEPGDPEIANVYEKLYPDGKQMQQFNDDEEQKVEKDSD